MKTRLIVEIDVHPAAGHVVDNLERWLDTIVPDLYTVRSHSIRQELVEE